MVFQGSTFVYIFYLFNFFNAIKVCHGGLFAFITNVSDYGDMEVTVLREHRSKWLRHRPKTALTINHVYLKAKEEEYYLDTCEPYIDVIIIGNSYSFKIRNEAWNPQKSFEGNKYIYYEYCNSELYTRDGIYYLALLKNCYRDTCALELWNRGSRNYVRFSRTESNVFGTVSAFADSVACRSRVMWQFDGEGIVFLRFRCALYNRQHVLELFFQDLNDNVISTLHIVSARYPYYIYPWSGLPHETHVPSSVSELDKRYKGRLLVFLKIVLRYDKTSTPLVLFNEIRTGSVVSAVFLSHPIAAFNAILFGEHRLYFNEYVPFIVAHQHIVFKPFIYALSCEAGKTVMHMIHYTNKIKYDTVIDDAAVKIYSFSLYINGVRDERMYSISCFTLGDSIATVYTANEHLAFGRIYGSDGQMIVDENDFKTSMEQFIICNNLFYLVIRAVDGVNFIRYFKQEGAQTWNRAMDPYPDFIPVISEQS